MKKEYLTHFAFLFAFFTLITLFKGRFEIAFIPFWLGGIFGTFLPDADKLLHVYFLKPKDVESQKTNNLLSEKKYKEGLDTIISAPLQRNDFIFHTITIQLVFLVFTFFILTSTSSLAAHGLVIAFLLHLIVDQLIDFIETKNYEKWFADFPFNLNSGQKTWYLVANVVILVIFGFLF